MMWFFDTLFLQAHPLADMDQWHLSGASSDACSRQVFAPFALSEVPRRDTRFSKSKKLPDIV